MQRNMFRSAVSPTAPAGDVVLALSCPDRPGIVHAVSSSLGRHGGNIVESQHYGDPDIGRFFMRIHFAAMADEFDMEFQLWDAAAPFR